MKRLVWLAIFAFVAWYGWNHRDMLQRRDDANEAVIHNGSGHEMTRVRLTVAGQTQVREDLADGADATFTFRNSSPSEFRLVWQFADRMAESNWTGGLAGVAVTPMRYTLEVHEDGQVYVRDTPRGPR